MVLPPYMMNCALLVLLLPSTYTPLPVLPSVWVILPVPLQSVRVKVLPLLTVMASKSPLAVMVWPLRSSIV